MIENIARIGEIYLSLLNRDVLELFVERLDRVDHVLTIILDINTRKFGGVEYAKLDKSNPLKYLYKEISPRGVGNSPTAKYNIKDLPPKELAEDIKTKVLRSKILGWFYEYMGLLKKIDNTYFTTLKELIQNNLDDIASQISRKIYELSIKPKTTIIITPVVRTNGGKFFIGELSKFKDAFMKSIEEKWGKVDKKNSKGKAVCFICGRDATVFGYALTSAGLIFATPDKPSFSPGLIKKDIWKYQSICSGCTGHIVAGWNFLNDHLIFRLADLPLYYISIPVTDDITIYNKLIKMALVSGEFTEGLINREDRLSFEAIRYGDIFYISYAFTEKRQKRLILYTYIDTVYPSRLRKIKETLESLDPLNFNGYIKDIMEKSFQRMGRIINYHKYDWYVNVAAYLLADRDKGIYKEFLEFLTDILTNKKPNIRILIIRTMDRLRNLFVNNYERFIDLAYSSLLLIMFITKLYKFNIIMKSSSVNLELNEYANKISEFLDQINIKDDALKAAFAVGVLVDYMLYIQRRVRGVKRGEEPFRKKLIGLYITPSRLRNVYKDAVEKLYQYSGLRDAKTGKEVDINNSLMRGVSQLIMKAEPVLDRADSEYLSYIFTLGMVLGYDLISKRA